MDGFGARDQRALPNSKPLFSAPRGRVPLVVSISMEEVLPGGRRSRLQLVASAFNQSRFPRVTGPRDATCRERFASDSPEMVLPSTLPRFRASPPRGPSAGGRHHPVMSSFSSLPSRHLPVPSRLQLGAGSVIPHTSSFLRLSPVGLVFVVMSIVRGKRITKRNKKSPNASTPGVDHRLSSHPYGLKDRDYTERLQTTPYLVPEGIYYVLTYKTESSSPVRAAQ